MSTVGIVSQLQCRPCGATQSPPPVAAGARRVRMDLAYISVDPAGRHFLSVTAWSQALVCTPCVRELLSVLTPRGSIKTSARRGGGMSGPIWARHI